MYRKASMSLGLVVAMALGATAVRAETIATEKIKAAAMKKAQPEMAKVAKACGLKWTLEMDSSDLNGGKFKPSDDVAGGCVAALKAIAGQCKEAKVAKALAARELGKISCAPQSEDEFLVRENGTLDVKYKVGADSKSITAAAVAYIEQLPI